MAKDRLAAYHRKRDFAKTPEPQGAQRRGPDNRPLFVIQKHAARRLHYDFRLEMDGVLKSWAVPKGPSLDPKVKRLAVHVEDHPLDYAGFEGIIPEGQYGGGTVLVWDTGTWHALDDDPQDAYRRGSLKFELDGTKLRGAWALVRMKGEEGKNWLLIKERDDAARPGSDDAITEKQQKSVLSGRDMAAIAKAKDRVWHSNRSEGVDERPDPSAIAGARKGRAGKAPTPQLATLVETVPAGEKWLHEIKLDGYRMLAAIARGKVTVWSRNGHDWTRKFPALVASLAALPIKAAVIDGEVVHLLKNGVSSFSALKDDLSRGDTAAVAFFAFDLLHLDGFDLTRAPLRARKDALHALLGSAPDNLRFSEHVVGRGAEVFHQACRLGLEGIVSKRADAPYRPGRGSSWVKVKCVAREEMIIIGWTDPGGQRQGFGSLLLGYYDRAGALRFAGGVGTGFTDKSLKDIRRRLDRLAQKTPPSREIVKAAPKRAHWVEPKLVAELQFSEWTPDGRLRHPSFLGLREDKSAREVVREGPTEAAETAESAEVKEKVSPTATVDVGGVRLSNAGKVLYPEDGFTKLDLARYYAEIADRMLVELAGRPLTLLRCPEGYAHKGFFQKHANATTPEALHRIDIAEAGKAAPYLTADDVDGLVSLVQMGVLEIHVWGSRRGTIECPDRVIFDLDPDENLASSRLIEAAMQVRAFLEELGLESFIKTTGGKGLHIVVPLQPRYQWDEIKAFAKEVAVEMTRREPAAYTAVLSKKARHGRVFIDYLRNQRGATAIAAYSARARRGATVAVPVTWKEVVDGMRSDAFTIKTLPRRLATLRADPWQELTKVRQSLSASLRRRLRAA